MPGGRNILIYAVIDPDSAIDECNDANNKDAADDEVFCSTGPD